MNGHIDTAGGGTRFRRRPCVSRGSTRYRVHLRLEVRGALAIVGRIDLPPRLLGDGIADEPHAAIAQNDVHPAGVPAAGGGLVAVTAGPVAQVTGRNVWRVTNVI